MLGSVPDTADVDRGISRSPLKGIPAQLIWALLLAATWLPVAAAAGEAARPLAYYTHQRWSEESDPPRPVAAFAQDHRGYIWIASAAGLIRFDGIRFETISVGIDLVENGAPSAILVRRNGEVWTNFERSHRFAVYREGQLRFLDAPSAPHRVSAMRETRDETIWVLTEQIGMPLMRFRNGHWTSFGAEAGAPLDNPFSMVVTSDGTVWVSFTGSVARLPSDGQHFEFVRQNPGATGRLSIDPQERIWLTERSGTYPITGAGGRGDPPPLRHAYATDTAQIRGWPMFDRDGNLWIATYYDGLQRVSRPDERGAASLAEATDSIERFTVRDGLSSNATTQLFQDAEGNIWLGTENGLDRFWPATLRYEPQLATPAAFGDLLLQASDGSIYIGEAATVYRVRPGGAPESILQMRVEPRTLCEAPDGAIWIGTSDKEVVIWREGQVRRLGQRAPLSFTIFDCAFDAAGDYWITTSLGGMARFRNGRWERMFGPASETFVPKSMVADERGTLFVHWNARTLRVLDGRTHNDFPIPFGSYQPYDVVLHPDARNTLFVAGRFGLAQLQDGHFQTLYARQAPVFSDVKGMVRTPAGDMWFAGPSGIVHMTADQLKSAFANPNEPLAMQVFGAVDGLRSMPHSHSRNAIVQGGDGRLWIATQTGTQSLDPASISDSRTPPRLAVSALVTDRVYRDPSSITLPAGTSNIQIDFSVFAFSNPRAAHVRYRITEQDPGWIEAGTRRQAFYTNLRPGPYTFQVIAANGDGTWNLEGATVAFEIPPTLFQSRWFRGMFAVLALIPLSMLYRARVAQVGRKMAHDFNLRLDERVNERTRIARELHDTLLQSFQGLMLRFQSARDLLPGNPADAVKALDGALDRADQAIAEGRDAIQNLRSSTTASNDLAQAITSLAEELTKGPEKGLAKFRMSVEGPPRELHPIVRDDIHRIAREALRNAFHHAEAEHIEAEVTYGARELRVRIRDDGKGMDPQHVTSGVSRHWGLTGMRERAAHIGAQLKLWSELGAGTEIELRMPGPIAYIAPAGGGVFHVRRTQRDGS
jgi:signal transduction histidine kinase/ligand-binding sensor domain-containing protein